MALNTLNWFEGLGGDNTTETTLRRGKPRLQLLLGLLGLLINLLEDPRKASFGLILLSRGDF